MTLLSALFHLVFRQTVTAKCVKSDPNTYTWFSLCFSATICPCISFKLFYKFTIPIPFRWSKPCFLARVSQFSLIFRIFKCAFVCLSTYLWIGSCCWGHRMSLLNSPDCDRHFAHENNQNEVANPKLCDAFIILEVNMSRTKCSRKYPSLCHIYATSLFRVIKIFHLTYKCEMHLANHN